jgi:hypothetical protein
MHSKKVKNADLVGDRTPTHCMYTHYVHTYIGCGTHAYKMSPIEMCYLYIHCTRTHSHLVWDPCMWNLHQMWVCVQKNVYKYHLPNCICMGPTTNVSVYNVCTYTICTNIISLQVIFFVECPSKNVIYLILLCVKSSGILKG